MSTQQLHRRGGGRSDQQHPGEREQPSDPLRLSRPPQRPAGATQFGVLGEDRPLEFLQLPPRLDPELVNQLATRALIALKRIRLPARSIQREHQLRLEAFSQRVLAHQRLELADQRGVPAEREIGVDPILERREALLLQPRSLALRKRLIREVRQRRPAPQRQRLPQPSARELRITLRERVAALRHARLESVRIELPRLQLEHVPAASGHEQTITQGLAQIRDVHLHGLCRAAGRALSPQLIDQAINRDNLPPVQQQHRQHSPLLWGPERQRTIVVDDLQRPKDSEFEQKTAPQTTLTTPRVLRGKRLLAGSLPNASRP